MSFMEALNKTYINGLLDKPKYPKMDTYLTVCKFFLSGLSLTLPYLMNHKMLSTILGFIIGIFITKALYKSWKEHTGTYLLQYLWICYLGSVMSGFCIGIAFTIFSYNIYQQEYQTFWLCLLLGIGVMGAVLFTAYQLQYVWDALLFKKHFEKYWTRRLRKKFGKKIANAYKKEFESD